MIKPVYSKSGLRGNQTLILMSYRIILCPRWWTEINWLSLNGNKWVYLQELLPLVHVLVWLVGGLTLWKEQKKATNYSQFTCGEIVLSTTVCKVKNELLTLSTMLSNHRNVFVSNKKTCQWGEQKWHDKISWSDLRSWKKAWCGHPGSLSRTKFSSLRSNVILGLGNSRQKQSQHKVSLGAVL